MLFLEPDFTFPNASDDGETVTAAVPVPDSATFCEPAPALSKSVSVALCAPTALGVNPTATLQLFLGAMPPDGLHADTLAENSEGLLELDPVTNNAVEPLFVTFRLLVTVSPRGALPVESFDGTETTVVGVEVGVAVRVAVTVAVGVAVVVTVAVNVGVAVSVGDGLTVAVGLIVAVGLTVAVFVGPDGPGIKIPYAAAPATSGLIVGAAADQFEPDGLNSST